ncbi:hypothetical protein FQR65_LT07168 [Abscondita terminalis]|nr:hypothetical protein FQR65_LT07168 [Abscondita terminalis]
MGLLEYKFGANNISNHSFAAAVLQTIKMFKLLALFVALFVVVLAEPEAKPVWYSGAYPYTYGAYPYSAWNWGGWGKWGLW